MLFAIRYDENDQLAAAALACDETPLSDAYWILAYARGISSHPECQTAYIDVADESLQRRLLALEYDDSLIDQCAADLQQLVESETSVNRAA